MPNLLSHLLTATSLLTGSFLVIAHMPATETKTYIRQSINTGPRLAGASNGYHLVWSDEFNKAGPPDQNNWTPEEGFQRNHEDQWYQNENSYCQNGYLFIEARKTHFINPRYDSTSTDWRRSRKWVHYTSGMITTRAKKHWKYGRFEIRAKIPAKDGLWPAFWTLGVKGEWPSNGEIDIMEYYQRQLLANMATGTDKAYTPKWFSCKKLLTEMGDSTWADQFHIWRMDWTPGSIALYVDRIPMLSVAIDSLCNPDGTNPFKQPHYILLNLAIGGDNGGSTRRLKLPVRYQIDYVRVYQKRH